MKHQFEALEQRLVFSDGVLDPGFSLTPAGSAATLLEVPQAGAYLVQSSDNTLTKLDSSGRADTHFWGDGAIGNVTAGKYAFDLASGLVVIRGNVVQFYLQQQSEPILLDTASIRLQPELVAIQSSGLILVAGKIDGVSVLAGFGMNGQLSSSISPPSPASGPGYVALPGHSQVISHLVADANRILVASNDAGSSSGPSRASVNVFNVDGRYSNRVDVDRVDVLASRPLGGFTIAAVDSDRKTIRTATFDATGNQIASGALTRSSVVGLKTLSIDRADRLLVATRQGQVLRFQASGALDTTYGRDGVAQTAGLSPTLSADGSIYTLSNNRIARYTRSTYAAAGSVTLVDGVVRIAGRGDGEAVKVYFRTSPHLGYLSVLYGDKAYSYDLATVDRVDIDLGGGDDRLELGDRLFGVTMNVNLGDGNDRLDAQITRAQLIVHGGAGNDVLLTSEAADQLFGDDGNDSLDGGRGNDSLFGLGGNDTLVGGYGDDLLEGGSGNDTLDASAGNDTLYGNAGFDVLAGGKGNDLLFGGRDRDTLFGGSGTDNASSSDEDIFDQIETLL